MEEDQSHMTERILNLTLEIIYLLTSGNLEEYNIVVKEEYKKEDEEYGVMEEFSEEYKHVMMVAPHNRRCPHPLYSRDSTQKPERCPRPLYSRDSTQEDLTIPHHYQVGGVEGT
ncbi:uncharacterized protein ACMZJ9_022153 [Mantella aurantiaca]